MASTAAILDILVKANTTQAHAALGKTQTALKATDKSGDKLTRTFKRVGGALAGAFVLDKAIGAVKGLATAASEAETSNARMRAQLKASGASYKNHAKEIENVIQKTSQLSGLDDEDLQDSFTNIVRITGDVNKSLKLTGLAADFARAKHMDVAKAGELVAKVAGGNTGILSRYGIKIKDGATATEALGELQKKFAGQAKAYGDTTAGAQDRFSVATENLKEVLGTKLLPIIAKVANAVSGFINGMISGTGAAGGFARKVGSAFSDAQRFVGAAVDAIRGFLDSHREDMATARQAIINVGKAVRWAWETVALPVIKRVLPAIQMIVKGAFDVIGGLVRLLSALLTGDFRKAWQAVKQIFRGALEVIGGVIRAATAPIREAAARIGEAIRNVFSDAWGKVRDGVRSLMGWFGDRVKDFKELAADMARPFVKAFDKIAGAVKKVIGFLEDVVGLVKDVIHFLGQIKVPDINLPDLNPLHIGGAGNGKTVGPLGNFKSVQQIADASLGWGLSGGRGPGQGYRPGDDGWHGQNRARDLSGPAGAMLAFAKALAASPVATRLLELIHTPLGFGIKNGQFVPNSFWGSDVLRDHYDHVHVAMRRGGKVPGMGAGDRVPALLEPGEFVVRKQVVDRFGPTFFAGLNGMKQGGIVDAARAAKAAGWHGQNLVRAVAIAGAESNYVRTAHALNSLEDSRGMWQVNVRAHPWARKLNLYNPMVAASAAHKVWQQAGGSFGPWTTWPGRAAAYMSRARRAVAALRQGAGKGKAPGSPGLSLGGQPIDAVYPWTPPPPSSWQTGGDQAGGGPSVETGAADLAAQLKRMNDFNDWLITTQGPTLVGAVVSAVNGGIGGRVGLGFQGIRSAPGSVAGL